MTDLDPQPKNRGAIAALWAPPDPAVVLLPDEIPPYYQGRQHPAALIQPFFETFIFLLIVLIIVDLRDGRLSPQNLPLVGIIIVALVIALIATIQGGRPPTSRLAVDPFTNAGTANPMLKWALGALFVLSLVVFGLQTTLMLSVVAVILRMVTYAARWAFYERRYVTKRRLVEVSGFFGSRIASMPLSRVTDIVYERSVTAELLSYANMRVETAGQDQALGLVRYITDPRDFYRSLSALSAPISTSAEEVTEAEEKKNRRPGE